MSKTKYLLPFLFFTLQLFAQQRQRVGVVLSGGGASGVAHVGVLKALEESQIPIDYIVGTSAGALVGAMYASGYSPAQIEAYVLSESFQLMVKGQEAAQHQFYFYQDATNASMFNFTVSQDSILQKSLPLAFVDPTYLDYEMLKIFGLASVSVQDDFNQLFIPYRCVASAVETKKSVAFSHGKLNQVVRASMTFPLYLNPLRVDGVLYFDGGLYNNFPIDVLYNDFQPDFIIGSNVSKNLAPVSERDFFGLLTSMMTTPTNYAMPCAEGIIIEPNTKVGTFDFADVQQAIQDGYEATITQMDSILKYVTNRVDGKELAQKRQEFNAKLLPFRVSSVRSSSERKQDLPFVRTSILPKYRKLVLDSAELEKRYFRTLSSPYFSYVYPTLEKGIDPHLLLRMKVNKANAFRVDFGGIISSRAINTGFLSLAYRRAGFVGQRLEVSSYFGKFYGSGKINYELVLPGKTPLSLSAYLVLNRWDYFKSFATFFEDVQPSFLIQEESYSGLQLKIPSGNHAVVTANARMFWLDDAYYQTPNFTKEDTADYTSFIGESLRLAYTRNTLNRKQFASSGSFIECKASYVLGRELTFPGSTSILDDTITKQHRWLSIQLECLSFPFQKKQVVNWGLHVKSVLNSQSLFANYTASMLALPGLNVLPDLDTYFITAYRSTQYVCAGTQLIVSPLKNIDFRLDAYAFLPIIQLVLNPDGTFTYAKPLDGRSILAAGHVIYHSPVGPVRATLNYLPKYAQPFQFQIGFGYLLFNERAIR
ncbi:MAG: patatin-like phospholipase family protein [Flavobacteriia bacterium]